MVIPVLLIALVFGGDRSGWLVLLGMLFLGAVGFIDDYEKLTKKQSLGLDERQKIILQVSLAAVLVVLYGLLTQQPHLQFIPFSRQAIDFSVFAYPVSVCDCVCVVRQSGTVWTGNSLCLCLPCYAWIAHLQGQVVNISLPEFCQCPDLLFSAVRLFGMPDGIVGRSPCCPSPKNRLVLPIGDIYVIEAASVLIQIFIIAVPVASGSFDESVHHHYELKGVPEQKIVIWFGMISLLAALLGV